MDGLKDIPYYKDGADIVAFLQTFKARVATCELSEAQKVTFLATRLSAAARGVLTSIGPVASLAEACDALALRLSRESAQSMADKLDLSMYRQEKDESCFDFYLRYTAALSAQAVVLSDERLMLDLRNKLSTLAREKLALHTTGRALTVEELLNYLRAIDRELYPRAASVHVTKGYGGKSGGRHSRHQNSRACVTTVARKGIERRSAARKRLACLQRQPSLPSRGGSRVGGGVVPHPLSPPTEAREGSSQPLAVVAEEEVAAAEVARRGVDVDPPPLADTVGLTSSTPGQPRPHQQSLQAGAVLVVGQEPPVAAEGEALALPLKRSA